MHENKNSHSTGSYLDKTTINLKQPEKMAQNIRMKQREREESRRNELISREIEELSECTFQPMIPYYNPPPSDEPVVVRGISRHLELQNLKARQAEEKRIRESQVFRVQNVDKYRNSEDGMTNVEPFHLSEYSARKSRAIQELEYRENSELTFSPVINERHNRSYLQKLLAIGDL